MVASSSTKAGKRARKDEAPPVSKSSLVPAARSIDRQTLGLCLALIAVVCAVYSPIVHNGFLNYDDKQYITDNPPVKAGLTWKTVQWAFTTDTEANWHPLTWLSHALDCNLFGLSPLGPHSVNVLLHAANAVLLFLLLESAAGFRWHSLIVAGLFALHPINVESVAWAAERKNVLSMWLFLLCWRTLCNKRGMPTRPMRHSSAPPSSLEIFRRHRCRLSRSSPGSEMAPQHVD